LPQIIASCLLSAKFGAHKASTQHAARSTQHAARSTHLKQTFSSIETIRNIKKLQYSEQILQ